MKKKRLISVIAASGTAAAGLVVAASSAQASQQTPACSFHAHACVLVQDTTEGNVHSIRVNGQCLWFRSADMYHYYANVGVNYSGTPSTVAYSGWHCEGNTKYPATVGWTSADNHNYRWVALSGPDTPHGPIT